VSPVRRTASGDFDVHLIDFAPTRCTLRRCARASYRGHVSDPEDVTQLRKSDLVEVEVDEAPAEARPGPLEADPADVADQRRIEHDEDDDERTEEPEY
jgi:hypothetical protein